AAPERRRAFARDPRTCSARLLDHRVDLGGRSHVVRERHATPAAAVLDAAVLRQLVASPQRDHHAAGLEEDDAELGTRFAVPAEPFVKGPRAREVPDAEGDEAES